MSIARSIIPRTNPTKIVDYRISAEVDCVEIVGIVQATSAVGKPAQEVLTMINRSSRSNKLQYAARFSALMLLLLSGSIPSLFADSKNLPQGQVALPIVNGTAAPEDGQPWMVALLQKSNSSTPKSSLQFCGGALIDAEWVLTAAHCVISTSPDSIEVMIGTSNLDGDSGDLHEISHIVRHPHYSNVVSGNDIALLKLVAPSDRETLALLTSYTDALENESEVTIYGWGQTQSEFLDCEFEFDNANINTDSYFCFVDDRNPSARSGEAILQQLEQNLLPHEECAQLVVDLVGNQFSDDEYPTIEEFPIICAITEEELGASFCFGDSGGPLVFEEEGMLYHAGVVSFTFSNNCISETLASAYTRVPDFLDFIEEVQNRDLSLGFSDLCPQAVTPSINYTQLANGNSNVRISWDVNANVSSHTIRYASFPAIDNFLGSVTVDAPLGEVSGELTSGLSFYISLQANNTHCSSSASRLVLIEVP